MRILQRLISHQIIRSDKRISHNETKRTFVDSPVVAKADHPKALSCKKATQLHATKLQQQECCDSVVFKPAG